MRPAGALRIALETAARELTQSNPAGRGPTLQEMATFAQVGYSAALHTSKNMVRAKALCITGRRKVPYTNKPVAEYKPRDLAQADTNTEQQEAPLDFSALAAWK